MFVIPAIDLKEGKCVRLKQGKFNEVTVYSDDPVSMAQKWEQDGADIIHVVDLDGALLGEQKNLKWVEKICKSVKPKIQLGGGIRSLESIERAINAGVRRVVLGTKALSGPFLTEALNQFKNNIVVGIDARDGKVAVSGWTEKTETDAFDFAMKVDSLGAARIIFTDVQTDGMLSGPPLVSIGKLCSSVKCGVIASGGVGKVADVNALQELQVIHQNLEGVIVGKALYEKKFSLAEVAKS
jgi:phosphoribosylformimino-5-aminoimidazole carboxamide ribotide isomerase